MVWRTRAASPHHPPTNPLTTLPPVPRWGFWRLWRRKESPAQWVWNPWRVYLWPTPFGWGYGLLLIALFLLAANYQLSLAYLTLFFASAFAVAAAVHTARLPAGVALSVRGIESSGSACHLLLTWQAPPSAQEGALIVASRDPQTGSISSHLLALADGHGQLTISLPTVDDRFDESPTLLLTTTLPWGLVRTWTLWQPPLFPRPLELRDTPGQPTQVTANADRAERAAASSVAPGIDWHGWRPAQTGEFARRPNRQQLARRDEVWLSDWEPLATNTLNQLPAPTPSLHRPALAPPSAPAAPSWLFLAAAGVLASLAHLPAAPTPWIALVALLIGATLLIHLRRHQPLRWLAPLAGLAIAALIRPIFGYGIGQETALALLAAAAWLKGWEAHTPRDLRTWGLTLAFFLTTAFLRDQRPTTALIVALGWGLLLIGWAQITRTEWRLPTPPGLSLALGRQLVATGAVLLPLVVLLFLLVPRLEQPLWGIAHDAARGKTGLSEQLTPGSISALAQSDEVALSLTWVGAPPPPAQLYLRAVVLTDYDGTRWHPRQAAQPNPATTPWPPRTAEQPVGQPFTLLLAPQPIPWLPLPEHTVSVTGTRPVTALADGSWQVATPLFERTLWQAHAQLTERWPQPLTPDEQARLTHLPADVEPRAQALGRAIAARHADPSERLAAIAAAFQAAQLRYTLNPPKMPVHPADTTLFDLRTGFCEHFAHAFAVVARAAGLPTRIVTGYQGATYNPTDGSWVVRHADAHAWAEVWIAGDWLRVDPTRWAAPERLDLGSTAALRKELPAWRALWFDSSLLSAVRQQLWAWQRRWDLWVVGFDAARQRQLWKHLGWVEGFVPQALLLLGATAASLVLIVLLPLPLQRADRVAAAWEAVHQQLAQLGIRRAVHEPLLPFAHRLETHLPTPLANAVVAALRQLIAYRYGPQGEAPTPQTLIKALRQLRWRLARYRWSRLFLRSS